MARETGVKLLKTICENTSKIEEKIHELSTCDKEYFEILYEIMNDLVVNKVEMKTILHNLETRKILRNHPNFYQLSLDEHEQNNFIIKPFEVEEGISICKKCGSKRVFSYQKQSRSSDEPSTTYCECVACRSRWTYSG